VTSQERAEESATDANENEARLDAIAGVDIQIEPNEHRGRVFPQLLMEASHMPPQTLWAPDTRHIWQRGTYNTENPRSEANNTRSEATNSISL
jgi:hypothetical protein